MSQKSYVSRNINNSANVANSVPNSSRIGNNQSSNYQDNIPIKRSQNIPKYETSENHIQQYLILLSEKISMMNMKIDDLKSENIKMFKNIENKTKILTDRLEEICGVINDESSISTMNDDNTEYEYYDDSNSNNSNCSDDLDSGNKKNHVCRDCYTKHQKREREKEKEREREKEREYKTIKNKKNKKYDKELSEKEVCDNKDSCDDSFKPKGIIVKFNGQNNTPFNPLDFLMNLSQSIKTKEIPKETDSDDEYDDKFEIYDEYDDVMIDNNYVNLEDKIENISDIIKIGEKYQKVVNNTKKSNVEEKKNINKKDNNIDSGSDSDSDSDRIFDVFNIKKKEKEKENKLQKLFVLDDKKYNINLEIVCKLVNPLKKLNRMVGLKSVKEQIFEMIIYYLQGFENENKNMLHSVIEGPPGVGKTKLGKIMAQVYCALDIIPSSRFKYVKATDLIGDHVGATKHMTQTVIDEADGGVLFIDEAYALSTSETKDPYGKECMDTLNFNLSENKKKLIVIIAGYPDQLEKCFFSHNPGLERRFPFRYKVDKYSAKELSEIFQDKLKRYKWKISKDITPKYLEEFFRSNLDDFKNFGGDIENFFKKCQFSHSKRTIELHPAHRGKLTIDDLNSGLKTFKENKKKGDENQIWKHMYM
jgi:hypothetical protein